MSNVRLECTDKGITTAGEGLQNLGIVSARMAFEWRDFYCATTWFFVVTSKGPIHLVTVYDMLARATAVA